MQSRTRNRRFIASVLTFVAVISVVVTIAGPAIAATFTATITNSKNTAASAVLSVGSLGTQQCYNAMSGAPAAPISPITATNTLNANCAGTLFPTTSPGTQTVIQSNLGTVPANRITQSYKLMSCAPVQLANNTAAANPMMPRFGTKLNGTAGTAGRPAVNSHPLTGGGSITLNAGVVKRDYAASVATVSSPVVSLLNGASIGIWFKTTSTAGGGLFSFDSSPTVPGVATGNNYLALYMTAAGKLGFRTSTTGGTGLSAASYNDGNWHFALVNITTVIGISAVNLYVDGGTTAVASQLGITLTGLSSGYWFQGWSQAAGYFNGSLSSFAVMSRSQLNGAAMFNSGTQAAYDTIVAASAPTGSWRNLDSGTTTFGGPYPVNGTTSPCSHVFVDVLMNTGVPGFVKLMSSLVTSPATSAAFAPPGGTFVGSMTLTNASATSFDYGLQIYAPLTWTVSAGSTGQWKAIMTWSSAASMFVIS